MSNMIEARTSLIDVQRLNLSPSSTISSDNSKSVRFSTTCTIKSGGSSIGTTPLVTPPDSPTHLSPVVSLANGDVSRRDKITVARDTLKRASQSLPANEDDEYVPDADADAASTITTFDPERAYHYRPVLLRRTHFASAMATFSNKLGSFNPIPVQYRYNAPDPWSPSGPDPRYISLNLVRHEDGSYHGRPASFLVFTLLNTGNIKAKHLALTMAFHDYHTPVRGTRIAIHKVIPFVPAAAWPPVNNHLDALYEKRDQLLHRLKKFHFGIKRFGLVQYDWERLEANLRDVECQIAKLERKSLRSDSLDTVGSDAASSLETDSDDDISAPLGLDGTSELARGKGFYADPVDITAGNMRSKAFTFHHRQSDLSDPEMASVLGTSHRYATFEFEDLSRAQGWKQSGHKDSPDAGDKYLPSVFRFAIIVSHCRRPFYPTFEVEVRKNKYDVKAESVKFKNSYQDGVIRPLEARKERQKVLKGKRSRRFELTRPEAEQDLMRV